MYTRVTKMRLDTYILVRSIQEEDERITVRLEVPMHLVVSELKRKLETVMGVQVKLHQGEVIRYIPPFDWVTIEAIVDRPRALDTGTTDEVQMSLVFSKPVIELPDNPDYDVPF